MIPAAGALADHPLPRDNAATLPQIRAGLPQIWAALRRRTQDRRPGAVEFAPQREQ
jgi:hypothetical protein